MEVTKTISGTCVPVDAALYGRRAARWGGTNDRQLRGGGERVSQIWIDLDDLDLDILDIWIAGD